MFDLPKNKIHSEKDWLNEIAKIKKEVNKKSIISNEKKAIELVKKSILIAFEKRIPDEKFGILFSGGVDSTLLAFLAKQKKLNFTCYLSVLDCDDLADPHDLERAISASKELNLDLKIKKTSLDELAKILPQVIKIINRKDPVHIGIATALWQAISEVKKDNLKYFLTGLGTEQIYAGGNKYYKTNNINKLCWEQLGKIAWQGDILRDLALEKHSGLKMLVPFFSQETILAGMQINSSLKNSPSEIVSGSISQGKNSHQKYILRKVAENLGLSKELAWRRTRPTQYGSQFDKGLEKLAKKNGFKYKKEYLDFLSL